MKSLLRRYWLDGLITLSILALSLLVYNATLTPSLSYKSPDGNELATIPYVLGLAHSTGYPLYTWMGKLFTYLPIGDIAHRVNLMSAVSGAAGASLLYLILLLILEGPTDWGLEVGGWRLEVGSWRLGVGAWRKRLAAGFAALLFAFSRTLWSQTGIAEVYASNLFMLALTLFLLLLWARVEERDQSKPIGKTGWRQFIPSRRSLTLLFLASLSLGLSLGTHMSNLGFAPAIGLFVLLISWRTALSPAAWATSLFGFGLGALQFLWLPYKAGTLNDRLMSRNAPNTLQGFYNYTLGAFPQFKFAFGWAQVPDRIVIYLALLVQQFGLLGALLGFWGMWVLLWRRPKRFFLLIGIYLVHVIFFTQYAVFDLDVFFIPAHFIFAIFIGYGLWQILEWLAAGARWGAKRIQLDGWAYRLLRGACVSLAVLTLALAIGRELRANWEHNDYSQDVAINDFYENVFQFLPADSVLLGRGGVFGYDMFYYRLVYNLRPDVLLPHIDNPNPDTVGWSDRPIFTNERLNPHQPNSPWSLPPDLLPADIWTIPVLLGSTPERHGLGGGRADLTLWQLSESPPELIVPANQCMPENPVQISLDGKTLVGYDLELEEGGVRAGQAVHLTLYWEIQGLDNLGLSLGIDGERLVTYEIGFGNLDRILREKKPDPGEDWLVVDDFWLVIPRTTVPGSTSLTIGDAPSLHPWLALANPGQTRPFAPIIVDQPAPLLNWR